MLFDQKYSPYMNAVAALTLPSSVRGFILASAVASAIASTLPVPAEPVASPESFFNANNALDARNTIGIFNNVAVLNYDQACALVRKFWILRYNAVHGKAVPLFVNGCFAECFSGIKYVLSEEELNTLNENTATFGRVRQAAVTSLENVKAELKIASAPQSVSLAVAG